MSQGAKFAVGQRVMALLASGGYAEYVAVDERLVMAIPENLSYDQAFALDCHQSITVLPGCWQAACIPETWLTAYQLVTQTVWDERES